MIICCIILFNSTVLFINNLNAQTSIPKYCGQTIFENLQWQCLGPKHQDDQISNQNFGAIASISANPNNDSMDIYIGGVSGGLWHTINGGNTWQNLTDNIQKNIGAVNAIIVDYTTNNRKIIIATGNSFEWLGNAEAGIILSDDDGQHWRCARFSTDDGQQYIPRISHIMQHLTNNKILFATELGFVWRSLDGGESFSKIYPITAQHLTVLDLPNEKAINSIVFHASTNTIYTCTKYKHHWDGQKDNILYSNVYSINNVTDNVNKIIAEKITDVLPPENNDFIGVKINSCTTQPDILHIAQTFSGPKDSIIITNYNMQTQQMQNINYAQQEIADYDLMHYYGLSCHPTNPAIHYFAGNVLAKSIDSLQSFTKLYEYNFGENNVPHTDIRSLLILNNKQNASAPHIFLGTDGGLSFSNNNGKSFVNKNGKYLPLTQFFGLGISEFDGNITAGSQDNSIMSYIPTTKKWIINIMGDGYDIEYAKHLKNELYGEYNSQQLFRSDNGIAPLLQHAGLFKEGESNPSKNLVTTKNGNTYFGGANIIYKKNRSSPKWLALSAVPNVSNYIFSYAVCEANENVLYAANIWNGMQNALMKTTDGGKTWIDISAQFTIEWPKQFNAGMFRIMKIYCAPDNDNEVWVCLGYASDYNNPCNGYNRIMYSGNGGNTWQDFSQGLPTGTVTDIVKIDGTAEALFASTNQGVFFKEYYTDPWKRYGSKQPNTFISELKIDYCNGNLVMSTFGYGLWQVPLPESLQYETITYNPSKMMFADTTLDYTLHHNLLVKKDDVLLINAPVYIAKGRHIYFTKEQKTKFGNNGKLINGCDTNYMVTKIKPISKKRFWLF